MALVKYGKKHFKSKYKVSLKNKITIEYLKTILKINRIKRFIKREFLNNKTNLVSIIFILIVIIAIIFLGIHIGEYNSFFEGLWEMKELLITNVILIVFLTIYSSEMEWHNKLINQYDIYYSIMCMSEWYINDLLSLMNYKVVNSIYIDEDNYYDFYRKISELKNNVKLNCKGEKLKKYLLYLNNKYINKMGLLVNSNEKFIGVDNLRVKELLYENIDEIIYDLENIDSNSLDSNYLKKYICNISGVLHLLIAEYRRPWRWDITIDKKIRSILRKDSLFVKGNFNRLLYYDLPHLEKNFN